MTPKTYSAVVTTGIYCRPGCNASPKQENVRPFAYAAAAEAEGFRPCLRCRPDTFPGPAPWLAPSELVCRALQLINLGALDEGNEMDLARRLGVSERHLRRLFDAHVGATPDSVARSRRVHFARRLLIETDLPIAQVVFAAGFGSVRQFNRAVQDVFLMTPSELRARRRRDDRLAAGAALELRLPFRPPLAWAAMLDFVGARAVAGVEHVAAGSYARIVHVDGETGAIELSHPTGASHLVLRVHLRRVDGLIHVVDQARRLFDLDADTPTIRRTLRTDGRLRPLVDACAGLRVPGAWDPFEVGVRAIIGQQVSVRGASTLTNRLVAGLGEPVTGFANLGLDRRFPEPETVADAELTSVGLTTARAAAVRAFATAVADGSVQLDGSVGLDDVVDRLDALPGIGPWTAHYIAMRACGEPDAFPAGDLGLRRALATAHGTPSERELAARAQAWRPWRAYAAMYLWTGGHAGQEQVRNVG